MRKGKEASAGRQLRSCIGRREGEKVNGSSSSKTERNTSIEQFSPGWEFETIAIASLPGKPARSDFTGDQTLFQLVDGRKWYADLYVAQKIDQMLIHAGEPFAVCKSQVLRGNQRIIEVEIKAVVEPPVKGAGGLVRAKGKQVPPPESPNNIGDQVMEDSLVTPTLPLAHAPAPASPTPAVDHSLPPRIPAASAAQSAPKPQLPQLPKTSSPAAPMNIPAAQSLPFTVGKRLRRW